MIFIHYYFLFPGEGGTRIWKWRVCNRSTFGVGFLRKGVIWCGIPEMSFFDVNIPKWGVIWSKLVKFERKFDISSCKLTKFRYAREARENWNFTFQFWEKRVFGVNCSEKRSHFVKYLRRKGGLFYWQADDIDRHKYYESARPDIFSSGLAGRTRIGRGLHVARGRSLPTPALEIGCEIPICSLCLLIDAPGLGLRVTG